MRVQGQSVALEKKQNKAKTMVLNWCQEYACTLCLASTGSIPIWKWQFEVRGLSNKAAELGKNSTISPLVTKIYHNLCPTRPKHFPPQIHCESQEIAKEMLLQSKKAFSSRSLSNIVLQRIHVLSQIIQIQIIQIFTCLSLFLNVCIMGVFFLTLAIQLVKLNGFKLDSKIISHARMHWSHFNWHSMGTPILPFICYWFAHQRNSKNPVSPASLA